MTRSETELLSVRGVAAVAVSVLSGIILGLLWVLLMAWSWT